ncbi:hypothetical protein OSB04_028939 [Centaurea solstitialis]|uniref:Uncharacterized protein n=1 Tax=Centaurea solstitialis TaxID=347529 RepID=A0AA38SP74_9ASTR|nr:hypothetical protein OSB04_028939 [Centaurea solstitialis]
MAASSSTTDATLSHSLVHLIPMKLCSSNYLLWKNQMLPLLTYQNLISNIDGSSTAHVATLTSNEKTTENPAYAAWIAVDHRTIITINATLFEEVVSTIIGLSTARQIWVALETAYGNSSIERVHNLRDQLRLVQKYSKSVAEYGPAIGYLVDINDQIHWFLDTDQFPSVFKKFREFRKKRKRVRKKRRSRRNFAARGPISRHEPIADNCAHLINSEKIAMICFVDPALLRPDEMIMILLLYLDQDQDQEMNESVLTSTDPDQLSEDLLKTSRSYSRTISEVEELADDRTSMLVI